MGLSSRRRVSILLLALLSLLLANLLAGCTPGSIDSITQSINLHTSLFTITSKGAVQEQGAGAAPAEKQANSGEQFLLVEELVIIMLFVAVLVGVAAHRLRIPYTIGLVLVGLLMTLRGAIEITISPTLILGLLIPPLVFEAAFHLNLRDLRLNLVPITILAVPGVLLTTLLVGGIVAMGAGMALPIALVFGAIVSATDPVSVVALFRKLGVPKRLTVLLEGESLFNDGTALVVFQLVLAIAIAGAGSFNLANGIIDFLVISGGGLAVGLLLGTLVSELIKRIDDYLIETTLTSVLAFGSFLIAELLGVSGVLAVVAAGLVNGNIGPRGMSPTTRIVVFNFWEYAAFLANTFVFLLIGLQIDLTALFQSWQLILWAIAAVLIARAASIYGLSRIGHNIPLKWQHVLYWGGLRGAISLALALSLPAQLGPVNNQIQVMTFGVVLFTLVVQGLSMKPLVRRLGIIERRSEQKEEYERRHARAVASRAGYDHLQRRHQLGMLSDHTWQRISPVLQERARSLAGTVREVMAVDPSVEAEELDTARREYYRAQRSAISGLLKDGVISDEIYGRLITEIDTAITTPQSGWSHLLSSFNGANTAIDRLMAAVVQEQDIENALSNLSKVGVPFTRLPSSGGYLSRRNATLLIGLTHGQVGLVVEALKRSCHKRVEYLSSLPEGLSGVAAAPIPVTVGGATIFTFAVERFETF
jgi:CPA1 family monovalent cation:H+ antiporter